MTNARPFLLQASSAFGAIGSAFPARGVIHMALKLVC
jgi:hypothetical protein